MVSIESPAEVVRAVSAPVGEGARSSAFLAAASAVSIGLNYVFLRTAGRVLGGAGIRRARGPARAARGGSDPAAALQMAVSREISRRVAFGDALGAGAFSRAALCISLFATVPLALVAMRVIQGFERFRFLGGMYIAPFVIRLPLFGLGVAVGGRLGAAIFATRAGSGCRDCPRRRGRPKGDANRPTTAAHQATHVPPLFRAPRAGW